MTSPKDAFTITTELFGDLVAAEGAPVDEIAALAEYARQIAAKAKSANTKRAYRSQWAAYLRYCDNLGLKPLSGDPTTVALFLASLHRDGKRLSTIRSHLAAVSTAHRLAGLRLDLGHRAIDSVLEGLKREMGVRPVKEAPPLLDTALKTFLSGFGSEGSQAWRNRCLILIGFGAALRRSEIVALDLDDIAISPEGLTVTLRRSKTDQKGEGQVVAIYRAADPDLCVVTALEQWLAFRGREPGPLFVRIFKGGRLAANRLSDRAIWQIIDTVAAKLGWRHHGFSPHSLRAGLITSASLKHIPLDEIMPQSRHRSYTTARKYVRNADAWRRNVTQQIFAPILKAPETQQTSALEGLK